MKALLAEAKRLIDAEYKYTFAFRMRRVLDIRVAFCLKIMEAEGPDNDKLDTIFVLMTYRKGERFTGREEEQR